VSGAAGRVKHFRIGIYTYINGTWLARFLPGQEACHKPGFQKNKLLYIGIISYMIYLTNPYEKCYVGHSTTKETDPGKVTGSRRGLNSLDLNITPPDSRARG
jgi:hypothetical protein